MVLSLTCAVQNYDWGITGDSEVASLGERNTGTSADREKPHAELWMGTHPSGPSIVKGTGVGLKETIAAKAEEFLGGVVHETFGADLPFLTKVLSVAKALSIQAHPDKTLARALHADRPHVYKDANHKPEMTLAITEFEALCGFVAHDRLASNLANVPELRAAAGEDVAAAFAAAPSAATLRGVFSAVMTAPRERVAASIDALVERLRTAPKTGLSPVDALALRLESQYPGDVGVLCAYLLNYVALRPGQCIYLAANEPHAYLRGECVEWMATSDNVVRAGLTPKLRDTAILCDMLTYKAGEPVVLDGDEVPAEDDDEDGSASANGASSVRRYVPPFDEFQLETYELAPGSKRAATTSPGPCVFLVTSGKGEMGGENVERGSVVFAKAGESVSIQAGEEAIVAYRAMINSRVFE